MKYEIQQQRMSAVDKKASIYNKSNYTTTTYRYYVM